ncbi:hypothetical protein GGR50DRAFT_278108 [Xylaria sp. CBS 124048]|nr:hypothetical protein GGR50DRAFT_278108 [Xylaria sp. CBS 124048]
MDSYTAAMNQRQQPQQRPQSPPRGVSLEDGGPAHRRNNSSRFDSHDDFYDFLDSNRGPPNPSGASATTNNTKTPPQAPVLPSQQQQRSGIPVQSRPPISNSNVRAPSFSGSRSEELLVDKSAGARGARQAVRRGAPPTKQLSGGGGGTSGGGTSGGTGSRQRVGSPTPPVSSGGSSPTHPHYAAGAPQSLSGGGDHLENSAVAVIPRLKSPSVIDCVLQPLDQKVREYDLHMRREQEEIKRLDDELQALQARRAEAETRFNEVRAKHDEYRRQYTDVERAMSGQLSSSMSPPQQRPATMHGSGAGAGVPGPGPGPQRFAPPGDEYHEEFDDDEDFSAPPFGPGRRISSQQSFGRTSQKTSTGKERFRFSNLFGGSR